MTRFYVGDKVEWTTYTSARRRFGVVISPAMFSGTTYRVVDFVTGDTACVSTARMTLVHGHIHIDTPQRRGF